MSTNLLTLLKENTHIDHKFLDTFYSKFKVGDDLQFHISETDICSYMNITIQTIRRRLQNRFSSGKIFFENVDYIKRRSDTSSTKLIFYLNYKAFQRLIMTGTSKESEEVRAYFTIIEEFLRENASLIKQAVEANLEDIHKYKGMEVAYFFAVNPDKADDLFKVGTARDIIERLSTYNTGRVPDVDLQYLALITNKAAMDNCIKMKLKPYSAIKNREIYHIEPKMIKSIVQNCYSEHISLIENEQLLREFAELTGLYQFVKGKKDILPLVLINKTETESKPKSTKKNKTSSKKTTKEKK